MFAHGVVHLEVTQGLETDSCVMALCHFQARRGNPFRFLSDNGTNFVGAERELQEAQVELDQDQITDELSAHGVR